MDVRCPGCRRAVSEWAARCPSCRADLATAQPIPSDDPPAAPARQLAIRPGGPAEGPSVAGGASGRRRESPGARAEEPLRAVDPAVGGPVARVRRVSPRRWAGLVVLALIVAAALRSGGGRRPGDHPAMLPGGRSTSGLPDVIHSGPATRDPGRSAISSVAAATADSLRGERLFIAEGGLTEAVNTDGTVLMQLAASEGPPAQPVAVGRDTVVYQRGGTAYAFDLSTGAEPDPLGPARQVFPAGSGRVDLVARSGRRQTVTLVDVGAPAPAATRALAGSDRVVAAAAGGLLIEGRGGVLELWRAPGARPTVVTGPISHVVATSGDEVAWTSVTGCDLALTSDCPLHLTDLATRRDRVVRLPDAIGFTAIGAFSPDGRYLAVYELPDRPQRAARLDLVVVRTATGAARTIGSVLDAGSVTPTVTWSPTGGWVFFGGSGSFDAVDFEPPYPAGAPDQPVPIPLSVTCCVVGF